MRQRAPLVLSIAALVVAVLGATPLGHAAGDRLTAVVPFAKTAGFAKNAGNTSRLNGRRSALSGAPGTIPVVGRDGKLPESLGVIGARGPQGERGPQGPAGPAGTGGAGGGSPSGPAGGDLTGKFPNPQVAANAIGSAEVLDNSLTGVDLNESTFAQVPSALTAVVGGFGRLTSTFPSAGGTTCIPPTSNAFDACAQIVVDVPARSRVFLLGRISGRPFSSGNSSAQYGTCRIGQTGAAPVGPSVRFIADKEHEDQVQGTLIGLSPPLGPGRATFTIDCAQGLEGVKGFQFQDAVIAAVALSAG
ncbi:MAG TPA: hypothetical protein VFA66_13755 [Gaiellaceae bacterium]|nr:hypothetical protein [Gaiellaceae bacterium]